MEDKLELKNEELKEGLKVYDLYGAPLVDEYAQELDNKVKEVNEYIARCKKYNLDYDIPTLQQFLMELASINYFVSERVEKLGSLSDYAKLAMETKYSEEYIKKQGTNDAGTKYSVAQLKSWADSQIIEEKILNFVYSHAYKTLSTKVAQGETVRNSINKILSLKIESVKKGNY